jgi:4-hydroxybenzoate polyprenyltransferase
MATTVAPRVVALVRAAHLVPCLAVTAFTTLLGAEAGNGVATCVLLAAAVLSGQLLIGWTNDRLDVDLDATAGRADKPLASGEISVRAVDGARACALVVTVVFSLLLGWRAGVLHLAAVACGLLYDYVLKRTWGSFVPYALAFGALPGIATLARDDHRLPPAWAVAAAALLGVAANLTNALPDLAADQQTGVRGLPNRLGASRSLALALTLLLAATVVIAFGPSGPATWSGWAGLVVTVGIVAGCAPALWRHAGSRVPFYAVIALVPVDLLMIVLAGNGLR